MKKITPQKRNFLKILRSEKGDAMILISIVITGLVVLVSTVALENLRKSVSVQGLQQKSLENLYKAEEGIEYSLYVNKEKVNQNLNFNNNSSNISANKVAFNLSLWDGTAQKKEDALAVNELVKDTVGRSIILVSQSAKDNTNDNTNLKRTLFANLPSRYYDQVSMGTTLSDCQNCQVNQADSTIESGERFEIVFKATNPYSAITDLSKINYRLTVNCGWDGVWNRKCEVQDLKIGVGCGDITSTGFNCPSTGTSSKSIACDQNFSVPFSNGSNIMSGTGSVHSIRFRAPSGIDLRGKNIVVRLKLNSGKLNTLRDFCSITNTCAKLKMCKKSNGTWTGIKDKSVHVGFDVKKTGIGAETKLESN